jgi:hypothetical protein
MVGRQEIDINHLDSLLQGDPMEHATIAKGGDIGKLDEFNATRLKSIIDFAATSEGLNELMARLGQKPFQTASQNKVEMQEPDAR